MNSLFLAPMMDTGSYGVKKAASCWGFGKVFGTSKTNCIVSCLTLLLGDGTVVNVIEGHPFLPIVAVSGIDDTIKVGAKLCGRGYYLLKLSRSLSPRQAPR